MAGAICEIVAEAAAEKADPANAVDDVPSAPANGPRIAIARTAAPNPTAAAVEVPSAMTSPAPAASLSFFAIAPVTISL